MKHKTQSPLFLHKHHIVDLYCWVADIIPHVPRTTGRPPLLTKAEITTILIWNAVVLKQKTLKDLHGFLQLYHTDDFRLPKYAGFGAACHRALPSMYAVLTHLLADHDSVRLMDATMLPVCTLHRADEHKVAQQLAQFGKNWQGWHYGFKLHASIALDGRLCGIALTGANVYDAQMMPTILSEHCRLAAGDTHYGARVMNRIIRAKYGTVVIAPPHWKQKKKIAARWQLAFLAARSKIESTFDYLKQHLHLVSSFPRSVAGYVLHYVRILLGYQIMALSGRF
jgi:hypothetical protein